MERITSVLPVPPVIFLRAAGCLVTNGVAAIGSKGVLKRMDSKQKAEELVNGKRQADYGHPKVNMKRIARIWSGILDIDVTPEQVALCMVGLKLARLVHSPEHEDTQVDMMGYLRVLQRLLDPEDVPLKYKVRIPDDAPRTIPVPLAPLAPPVPLAPLAPLAPSVNPLTPPYAITYSDGSKDMTFEEAVGLPKPDPNTGAKYMHREVKPTKDLTPEETRVLLDTGMYWYLTELNRLRGGNSCGQ